MTRFSTLALALVAITSVANAQEKNFDQPYIGVKAKLGFGGVDMTPEDSNVSFTSGLSPSFGLAGQYVYPLHEFFAVGGMLGITSWRSSEGGDGGRNLNFDLAVLPVGKYAVLENLELYLTLPLGLTLDFLNEVDSRNGLFSPLLGGGGGTKIEGGGSVGFMISLLVGARYALSHSMGLLAELGWEHHAVTHGIEASIELATMNGTVTVGTPRKVDYSVVWDQFVIHLGAYF